MTARAEYTAEEWGLLKSTPFIAGMAVAFADGAGVVETLRESVALVTAQVGGLRRYPDNELVKALLTDRTTDAVSAETRKDLSVLEPSEAARHLITSAVEDCRRVVALLEERSHVSEREGYLHLVMDVARATALAARTGGLFGRGPLVDRQELDALGLIADALGVDVGELPAGSGDNGTNPPTPDASGDPQVPSGAIEPR